MKAIAERFADASYALLTGFLRADVAAEIAASLAGVDSADGLAADSDEAALPNYHAGEGDGWATVGPPHLRRYLRYEGQPDDEAAQSAACERVPQHKKLGSSLHQLSAQLFRTASFYRWLHACTRLEPRSDEKIEIRRFRPGLDYTVAACVESASKEFAELDATLMFASGTPSAEELWTSEDVGGFESYLAADDDEETVQAQEVYRGADIDGPLVNVVATPNALSLVMRDAKTLRFVKYLSRDAPSSRVDIAASFRVDAPDASSSSEEETAGASGAPDEGCDGAPRSE